jgi:hypothetical protein
LPKIAVVALLVLLGVAALAGGFEGATLWIESHRTGGAPDHASVQTPASSPSPAEPDDPESMSHPETIPGAWTGPAAGATAGTDADEDDGEIPTTCDDARRELATMVAVVSGQAATCTEDSECLAYGEDPRDACSSPRFTSAHAFRRYRRRHDLLIAAIAAACAKTTEACEDEVSKEPACIEGSCAAR